MVERAIYKGDTLHNYLIAGCFILMVLAPAIAGALEVRERKHSWTWKRPSLFQMGIKRRPVAMAFAGGNLPVSHRILSPAIAPEAPVALPFTEMSTLEDPPVVAADLEIAATEAVPAVEEIAPEPVTDPGEWTRVHDEHPGQSWMPSELSDELPQAAAPAQPRGLWRETEFGEPARLPFVIGGKGRKGKENVTEMVPNHSWQKGDEGPLNPAAGALPAAMYGNPMQMAPAMQYMPMPQMMFMPQMPYAMPSPFGYMYVQTPYGLQMVPAPMAMGQPMLPQMQAAMAMPMQMPVPYALPWQAGQSPMAMMMPGVPMMPGNAMMQAGPMMQSGPMTQVGPMMQGGAPWHGHVMPGAATGQEAPVPMANPFAPVLFTYTNPNAEQQPSLNPSAAMGL